VFDEVSGQQKSRLAAAAFGDQGSGISRGKENASTQSGTAAFASIA